MPTLSTQPSVNRIQEIIAETKGKQSETSNDEGKQDDLNGDKPEEKSQSTGKMSQDDINALIKKKEDKQK